MGRSGPYTHAGFRPVAGELAGVPLKIDGELPAELDGVFLRNGLNAMHEGRRPHMFDGEAMLHQIELRGGAARYSNSYVRTPRTRYIEAKGRNPFVTFNDIAGGGKATLARLAWQGLKVKLGVLPRFRVIDSVAGGTAILHHNDRLFCLQETGLPFVLKLRRDPDGWLVIDGDGALEDFGGRLAVPFSAHPKTDPETGDVHSISHDVVAGATHYVVLTRGGGCGTAGVAADKATSFFVHDFIVTDRFVVFPDSSLRFDPRGLAGPAGSVASFRRDRPLRFGVIARDHRDGDPVRWFDTAAPGHIWHLVNAWERLAGGGTEILVYGPAFADYPGTVPIHTPDEPAARLMLWRLDLATGRVAEERVLLDEFHERPGINPRRAGKRARYAWLLDQRGGVMGRGALKYDLIDERKAGYLDYGAFHGGEPLFVPKVGAVAEDDGWLLDLITTETAADLIVIDAATMAEQARIRLPRRVPFGVHALWLDRAETDRLIAA